MTQEICDEAGVTICGEVVDKMLIKVIEDATVGGILDGVLFDVVKDVEDFNQKLRSGGDLDLRLSDDEASDDDDSDGYEPTYNQDPVTETTAEVKIAT